MEDYYIRPVDKGQSRNTNNLLVNSHPGIKLYALQDHFTLASALWDPYGVWGPAGNYLVYDIPFLTYGKTTTIVPPSTTVSGGVSVEGPFYGFEGFSLHGLGSTPPYNEQWADLMAIHIRRLDENMNEVASWTVEEALPTDLLSQMRDFATTPEGIYELTFPQEDSVPTNFYANVENMMTTDDVQVIGVQFNGNLNPEVAMQSPGNYVVYQEVSSLQDVINSAGETFWQDSANDMVWVKLRGGTWAYWTNDPNLGVPSYDELLYETTTLRIFEP